jgi:hypothetical protein
MCQGGADARFYFFLSLSPFLSCSSRLYLIIILVSNQAVKGQVRGSIIIVGEYDVCACMMLTAGGWLRGWYAHCPVLWLCYRFIYLHAGAAASQKRRRKIRQEREINVGIPDVGNSTCSSVSLMDIQLGYFSFFLMLLLFFSSSQRSYDERCATGLGSGFRWTFRSERFSPQSGYWTEISGHQHEITSLYYNGYMMPQSCV